MSDEKMTIDPDWNPYEDWEKEIRLKQEEKRKPSRIKKMNCSKCGKETIIVDKQYYLTTGEYKDKPLCVQCWYQEYNGCIKPGYMMMPDGTIKNMMGKRLRPDGTIENLWHADKKKGYATVKEVLDDILKTLTPEYQAKVREMTQGDFCNVQHFGLGMDIRNKYFYQNPLREQLIVHLGMENAFPALDGDEFSGIILRKLYRRITAKKKE